MLIYQILGGHRFAWMKMFECLLIRSDKKPTKTNKNTEKKAIESCLQAKLLTLAFVSMFVRVHHAVSVHSYTRTFVRRPEDPLTKVQQWYACINICLPFLLYLSFCFDQLVLCLSSQPHSRHDVVLHRVNHNFQWFVELQWTECIHQTVFATVIEFDSERLINGAKLATSAIAGVFTTQRHTHKYRCLQ